ncbi:MAG: hypothetical protein HQL52_08230 [Magnetococcales bacterium]|nr:hypothetical protein [Magnetococcales bacterium]
MGEIQDRHYVFWARHFNDIDHMVPIIHGLLKYGVPVERIRYVMSNPLPPVYPKRDQRLSFLTSRGVTLETPHLSSVSFFLYHFLRQLGETSRLFSVLFSRMERLYSHYFVPHHFQRFPNWRHALKVVEATPPGSLFIFDHSPSKMYRALVKKGHEKGIASVAVPHGLLTFWEHPNPDSDTPLYGKECDFFDKKVMTDAFFASQRSPGLSPGKAVTLGSARFCPEWMAVIEKIYDSSLPRRENRLHVLFLMEKAKAGTSDVYDISMEEQFALVSLLDEDPGVELFIKRNTRGISPQQSRFLAARQSRQFGDEVTTHELVSWADVVVGSHSSVILDPMMRGKVVLLPVYMSRFPFIFDEYKLSWLSHSRKEFAEQMDALKKKIPEDPYGDPNSRKFLTDLIFAGNPKADILHDYFLFLSGSAIEPQRVEHRSEQQKST